jgi:protein-arginine kinase activator protein McsA
MVMRQGDDIVCAECGKEAFVAKRSIMDGWTKKGEVFVCSACGAELGPASPDVSGSAGPSGGGSKAAMAASLLGLELEERKRLDATEEERRFCRDCANFVSHPFLSRCERHVTYVIPMDDCEDFEPKRGDSGG